MTRAHDVAHVTARVSYMGTCNGKKNMLEEHVHGKGQALTRHGASSTVQSVSVRVR